MEVVVRQAEAVVAGAQRPVPVLILRADAGVQLHQFVTGERLQMTAEHTHRPVGMVDLDEIRAPPEPVQLELLLGGQQRQERVIMDHVVASEHELVELEGAVALLVDIDLERGVERMDRELVVVGEGDDVVPEFLVLRERLVRPFLALVRRERALDAGMGVEIGPFPAVSRVQAAVRVEDVRPAERLRGAEVVNGADGSNQDGQE